MKNILEEEKKFDSKNMIFFWKIVPNWVYFGQREDFKLTTEKNNAATRQSKTASKKQYCLCQ